MQKLTLEEIRQVRNSAETSRVISELRKRLDYHLYFDKEPKGDLMQKALNYMHSFWEPLFRYRNDGNYTIDNFLAERSIRPMTVERKIPCSSVVRLVQKHLQSSIRLSKLVDYLVCQQDSISVTSCKLLLLEEPIGRI